MNIGATIQSRLTDECVLANINSVMLQSSSDELLIYQ